MALVVLCFLSAILGYRWVRGFLRSDDFRLLLGSEAGKVLDAEAQFTPFRWDGWSVSTDQLSAAGEGKLVSLEANDLEAGVDVGAVWDGVYRLEDILIRGVKLKADFRKKKDSPDESDEPVDNIRSAGGESHFWDRFLPNQFEMTGLRLSSVDGSAITDAGEWRWADSAAEVKPGSSDGAYDLQITGGRIETPLELVP